MYEQLKLDNQVCFPLYNAARLVVRAYTPLLKTLGITYPQYLVLLALWEKDKQTVNEIVEHLLLETNTVTPLLQRMEKNGIITRIHDVEDRRRVIVRLTDKGKAMEEQAANIPHQLIEQLPIAECGIDAIQLRESLKKLIALLK